MLVCTIFYRIILVYVTIIMIINDILVIHVSTCIGHLQVTVKIMRYFAVYLSGSCYWCGVCSELCLFFECFPRVVFISSIV